MRHRRKREITGRGRRDARRASRGTDGVSVQGHSCRRQSCADKDSFRSGLQIGQTNVGRGGDNAACASADDSAQGKHGRFFQWAAVRCASRNARSMEAWAWRIQHYDFDFAMAAADLRPAGDPHVPTRMFRANFNETPRLQFTGKSARVFARSAGTRCRVSRDTRTRYEAVC